MRQPPPEPHQSRSDERPRRHERSAQGVSPGEQSTAEPGTARLNPDRVISGGLGLPHSPMGLTGSPAAAWIVKITVSAAAAWIVVVSSALQPL